MKDLLKNPVLLAALAVVVLVGIGAYVYVEGVGTKTQADRAAKTASSADSLEEDPLEADGLAPDFSLQQLGGETFRLSDHRGKVVAINFWATWCPPCREEIPDLVALQNEMQGEVLFVGVSLDKGDPETVRAFADEFGINYPLVIDDGSVLEKYGPIPGLPTTFFVGPGGRLRVQALGLLTEENLRPMLQALAEGEEPENLEPPFRRVRRPGAGSE